jgi:hypothetical protein
MEAPVIQPRLGLVYLLVVCIVLLSTASVLALNGTPGLAVVPITSDIVLNGDNSVNVNLYLSDAVAINAFDVIVTYDSAIVSLDSYAYDDYLISPYCLIQSNNPGELRLVCTQINEPGVSGDGNLLNLTFSGLSAGLTAIRITKAELANEDNALILPSLQHGTLRAFYEILLSGTVGLQGQTAGDGVTVSLDTGTIFQMGPYSAVSQDLMGANVDFGTVVGDTYGITAAFPRYIALTQGSGRTVTISPDKTTLNPLRLLSGNAVWTDNVIDDLDLALVRNDYLKTTNNLGEGESLDGDVNHDGVVDLQDLALVGGNYGLSSTDAYTDWVP